MSRTDSSTDAGMDIDKLAQLAQLSLADAERNAVTADLNAIIGMIDAMQAAAVGDTKPMSHPLDLSQRLRADEITETVNQDAYQALAPQAAEGFYLVPRVLD